MVIAILVTIACSEDNYNLPVIFQDRTSIMHFELHLHYMVHIIHTLQEKQPSVEMSLSCGI
jgi:hypothetical protein